MFAKIWRWLIKLWQQLLGKPPQPSPPGAGTSGGKPNPRLSDAEFEKLFLQLLDRVEENPSRQNIKGFLFTKLIDEDELVAWLRRFGSKLLESPETHRKLARRMVQLGKVAGGELGDVAGKIGRELLVNSGTTSFKPIINNQTPVTKILVSDNVPLDLEAEEWNNRGVSEYNAGNIEAALPYFQRAVAISSNYHVYLYNLGVTLNDLKQHQQAIEVHRRALKIFPNFHYAWFDLGNALSNLGQYQQAIEAYRRAIKISPNFHDALNNLGNALYDLGQYQQAIGAYNRAIEISPNFCDAWNNLGNVLNDLGQYQQAVEAYNRVIEIFPNFGNVWNGLGIVLRDLGQYEKAIKAFNQALEITHNQYWQAWANLGWAIYYLHGYQAALRNWDEGLQSLQPETPDYQEGCAVLHHRKGDAHYLYGKRQPNPQPYWRDARNSYITALKTLSGSQTSILGEVLVAQVSPRFQLLYLEILQKLAKVCNALNYQDDFQLCLDIGDTMLENLLLETESQERKIQLAKKFATFSQLRVVLLAQSSQPKEALLLAEKRKNLCLRWLRESRYVGMKDETPLEYPEIEQLLSPGMAAIYWHYSPAAITTFIIKYNDIQIHLAEEPPSPNPFPRNGGRGEGEGDSDSLTPRPLQREKGEGEAEEPPSPSPFPRNGGRGEGEGDSDSLTPRPLQREKGEGEAEEPPSPSPFPRNGGRGEGEGDSDSLTPRPLQR
ncbi:tetratricopeptide repeat protein, partial [Argonema antarcticum]|uniref:tetratricopeptide repeat protein n=1 Tax=Argonema antarcticum TaxID=2942763 RepID=UPI002011CC41